MLEILVNFCSDTPIRGKLIYKKMKWNEKYTLLYIMAWFVWWLFRPIDGIIGSFLFVSVCVCVLYLSLMLFISCLSGIVVLCS